MAPARQRRYYPLHRLASLAASCRGADCVGWTMPIGRLRIKRSIIGMLRQRRNALLALKSKESLILHSLLSVGVGLLACIAVTKGAHRYFQKLNYIVSSIESISENISNKYIYYYESLFDAGVNSNIIAIEVFYVALAFLVFISTKLLNLLIAAIISIIIIFPISVAGVLLTGRKSIVVISPVGISIAAFIASTPWIAPDLFWSVLGSIKKLLQNPIVIACAVALGVWRTVSAARSHRYDPDPVTEGAKEAWKFATGSAEEEIVNMLKKNCSDAINFPPSFRHWAKLWVALGVITAIDYFFTPARNDFEIIKHVALFVVILLVEFLIALEALSFIVHTRRNRIKKQKENIS